MSANMLKILLILSKDPAWPTFIREFKQIRDDNMEQAVHYNPDPQDFNAKTRQDLFRGIAVCLDVLHNSFNDPVSLLEEINLAERMQKQENEIKELARGAHD
jgi:AAA+ ATPase superfamily predicted ATPase